MVNIIGGIMVSLFPLSLVDHSPGRIKPKNTIGGIMVSLLPLSVVNHRLGRIKPKTIAFVFAAFPQCIKVLEKRLAALESG
jgi:hypothetical protein